MSRYRLLLLGLIGLLLVSCVVSLGFGAAPVPVEVVWRVLLFKVFGIAPKPLPGPPARNISSGLSAYRACSSRHWSVVAWQ